MTNEDDPNEGEAPGLDPALVDDAPGLDPALAADAASFEPALGDDAPGLDPALVGDAPGLDPALAGDALADAPGFDPALVGDAPGLDPALLDGAMAGQFDGEAGRAGAGLRLSAEESEALLDAIRSGAASGAARKATLGSADEPMRRALRTADEALPTIARTLQGTLLRVNAGQSETAFEPSSVVTYESFGSAIDPAAATWRVHAGNPREPLGLIVIGSALASAILERRLGAPSTIAGTRPVERAPSPLERRVLEPMAREVLAAAVKPFLGDASELALCEHRTDIETVSRFAPCLRMYVSLVLKSGTTTDVTIALFGGAFVAKPVTSLAGGPRVMEAVEGVEVNAVAILGHCVSTVRDLLSLETGSVLRLDGAPDRPIEVRVDGVPLLRGMPVVKDGNMAIEVRS